MELRANHCPVCDSENLDYGCSEVYDDMIEYPFTCLDCGFKGSEWATLVFSGFTDEDRKEIEE